MMSASVFASLTNVVKLAFISGVTYIIFTLSVSTKVTSDVIVKKSEIAIFRTILHEGRISSTNEILIHEHSTGNTLANVTPKEIEELIQELGAPIETIRDWEKRNKRRMPIVPSLDIKIKYRILSTGEFDDIFGTNHPNLSWENLRARYSDADGFVRLSKPGFDSNDNNSLVLIEHHCGPTCGEGRFLHLRKNNNEKWTIVNSLLIWMAY